VQTGKTDTCEINSGANFAFIGNIHGFRAPPLTNSIALVPAILDILPRLLSLRSESKDTLNLHQHFNWKRLWQVETSHSILGQRNAKHVQGQSLPITDAYVVLRKQTGII